MTDRDRFERNRGQRREEQDSSSDFYNDDRSFGSLGQSSRGRSGFYNEDSSSRSGRGGYSRLGGAGEEDYERRGGQQQGSRDYGREYGDERGYYGSERSYGQERGGYGQERGGYGQERGGYGQERGGYGQERGGYASDRDRDRYGQDRSQFGGQYSQRDWGQQRGDYGQGGYGGGQAGYGGGRNQFPYMGNAYSSQRSFEEGSQGTRYGYGQPSQGSQYGQRSERGRFAGQGPKGYKRSDERIREEVSDALMMHPEIDASEIEVKVSDGEVTLTGTVQEREDKWLAEQLCEGIPGVRDVSNSLRVKRSNEREASSSNESARVCKRPREACLKSRA
jgi:osmotically-inducible protein OsmY